MRYTFIPTVDSRAVVSFIGYFRLWSDILCRLRSPVSTTKSNVERIAVAVALGKLRMDSCWNLSLFARSQTKVLCSEPTTERLGW